MSTPYTSLRPLLDVHVRSKRFGTTQVLHDLRLQLDAGEIVTLVGASGCGKSTLLRIVGGLDSAYDGGLRFEGRTIAGPCTEIGFIFQEPRLFPWLSVVDNVAFRSGRPGAGDPRVQRLLDEVGLTPLGGALPKELSGGQAQRVALARGLYTEPRLLLLDEPFSAVDAFTRIKLQDLLLRVARTHGITVLMVTHDVDEACLLSDRVLVLRSAPGRIAEEISVPAPRPWGRERALASPVRPQVYAALGATHAFDELLPQRTPLG